jgi:NAD(P)-dependent dehydrogenase (short-subunit alcohol dehydrogenase family)
VSYSLAGKNVLITGASSGIGAALADGFARRGATIGICARRPDRLAEVLERVREHAPNSKSWIVDLTDLDAVDRFARDAETGLGGIDVLVNNAGMPKRKDVLDLTPDAVDQVMHLNYTSPIRLTLALLEGLIARAGRVVNISSVAARLSPPGEAAYAASKAALSAWSECIRIDLADTEAKVHVVYPGVFATELFNLPGNDPPVAPLDPMPVTDIVEPILHMIEEEKFEIAVPEWFNGIFSGKFNDVEAYLDGTVAWLRTQ